MVFIAGDSSLAPELLGLGFSIASSLLRAVPLNCSPHQHLSPVDIINAQFPFLCFFFDLGYFEIEI